MRAMRRASGIVIGFARMLDLATRLAAAAVLLLATLAQITAILVRQAEGPLSLVFQETAAAGFLLLVFLSIPVTIAADRHVRLELFATHPDERPNRRWEWVVFVLLAVPFFAILLYGLAGMALDSWRIGERFSDVSGLPGFWLIRFVAAVAVALCILQAAARVLEPRAPEL